MNKKLLDILVCPFDKVSSLELLEFKAASTSALDPEDEGNKVAEKDDLPRESPDNTTTNSNPVSEKSLHSKNNDVTTLVEEGILLCKSCLRFYPITEEIPIILPDELRDKKKDLEFLKKWKANIPREVFINLKPWTL